MLTNFESERDIIMFHDNIENMVADKICKSTSTFVNLEHFITYIPPPCPYPGDKYITVGRLTV